MQGILSKVEVVHEEIFLPAHHLARQARIELAGWDQRPQDLHDVVSRLVCGMPIQRRQHPRNLSDDHLPPAIAGSVDFEMYAFIARGYAVI